MSLSEKEGLTIETNPFAFEIRKELKDQILHQIIVCRYNFSFSNDIGLIFNSVQTLHDIIVSLLNAKYNKEFNDSIEDSSDLRKYTNPALKVLKELDEKKIGGMVNKEFIEMIQYNPKALEMKGNFFRLTSYLHEKFRILVEIAIRRNLIKVPSKLIEVV